MQPNNKTYSVSVVIPAFNEEKMLSACLTALSKQHYAGFIEVIVVDNNSTDKTADVAATFKGKLPIRVIHEKLKGRSPARRAGFAAAKGDILFSTDADTIVPPTWIEDIVPYFSTPTIAAVTGTCKIEDCSKRINTTFNLLQPQFMKQYRLVFGHYWLSGFNFAIRKEAYERSGGFDPSLNAQEDTDLAFRVHKIGKIKFINQPKVIFSGRRMKNGLILGLYPYAKSYGMYLLNKRGNHVVLSDVR